MIALFINALRGRISLMVYPPQPPLGGIVVTVGQTVSLWVGAMGDALQFCRVIQKEKTKSQPQVDSDTEVTFLEGPGHSESLHSNENEQFG